MTNLSRERRDEKDAKRERNDDDDDEEIRRERNAKGDKCAKGVGPWQFPGRPPLLTINYIFVPSC